MAICRCKGRNGHAKYRYRSIKEANVTAARRGWAVTVYACPSRMHTFHITHMKKKENPTS